MSDVFVEIEYDINKDSFKLETNAKNPKNIIANFLRSEMGEGEDLREAKKLDVYKIRIDLQLHYDKFSCSSNTGNSGLTDGILMRYLSKN